MEISLEQAIEIHARVLKKRLKRGAPHEARKQVQRLKDASDHDGHDVWNKVAVVAERMLVEESWGDQGDV
jgi:hypothetical protein